MHYQFNDLTIMVIGDIMLDRYWFGHAGRISPEAPVPVVHHQETDNRLGGAGHVAANLKALGAKVKLLGFVGDDEAGAVLEDLAVQQGIESYWFRPQLTDTHIKLRVYSAKHAMARFDFNCQYHDEDKRALMSCYQAQLDGVDVVVLSDYAKGTLTESAHMVEMAQKLGKKVVVDPGQIDLSRYYGADLLIPNTRMLNQVIGASLNAHDMQKHVQSLISSFNLGGILLSRGQQGMSLFRPGRDALDHPAVVHDVVDKTGVADTVVACAALMLGKHAHLPALMHVATVASSVVVQKLGTAVVSYVELADALHKETKQASTSSGVVTREVLSVLVREAKRRGEQVVMTNGCFDLLHAGHVAYLQEAKKQGDRLVVALNSDESIQAIKGPTRPILPIAERMAMVAGLSVVDWVVSFDEDTPENLLREVQPDILVKGSDYTVEQIVGADIVHSYGGKVERIQVDYPHMSTSNVLDKIQGLK